MFLIVFPDFLSSFLPYTCLIVLWSPHWVASRRILFVYKHCFLACLQYMWVVCIITIRPSVIFVVIFIFCLISWTLRFLFFLCAYDCYTLLFPFTSVVWVDNSTLMLHSSVCSSQIWSYFCLNWLDIFPFFVVSSVNAVSWATVADVKIMKESSISTCFMLLSLTYLEAPSVWSSSSLSRYTFC